jgi:DNA polymerase-3 subunit delta'
LRTPPSQAVANVLTQRDGVDPDRALAAARAAQGHIGRARRLATDPDAARRRDEVLRVPFSVDGLGAAMSAAARLVKAAESEAKAVSEELDEAETTELRRAFGEGSSGKGVAKALRGAAGALKELSDRQKSRSTRMKRDALDRALLDLAGFYRDVLAVQFGAPVELANEELADEIRQLAAEAAPETTLRRTQAIMQCRERIDANVHPLLAVEAMTVALRTS